MCFQCDFVFFMKLCYTKSGISKNVHELWILLKIINNPLPVGIFDYIFPDENEISTILWALYFILPPEPMLFYCIRRKWKKDMSKVLKMLPFDKITLPLSKYGPFHLAKKAKSPIIVLLKASSIEFLKFPTKK